MEEGKIGEVEAKVKLRRNIIRDINYLLSKGLVSDREVYYLIKNFLRNYMHLEYEFTKDELFEELKTVYLPYTIRSDFFKFIDRIFMFEYSQVSYSDEELKALLEEFKGYLDYLLVPNFERKQVAGAIVFRNWKKRFGEYLKGFRKKEEQADYLKQKEERLPLKTLTPIEATHVDINSLLEKIYYSIYNSDVESAVELYQQVVELYNRLSPEEKADYYETLNSVYESIRNS